MATLHFKSPAFTQRGYGGILFHRSKDYIQPGYGRNRNIYMQHGEGWFSAIGTIFKSLMRWLVPAAKNTFTVATDIGRNFVKNPAVKDIIDTVKQEAVRTGVNAAANLIAGQPVAEPAQEDIAEARKNIAQAVRKIQPGSGKKRPILATKSKEKKRRKVINLPEPNIFTD